MGQAILLSLQNNSFSYNAIWVFCQFPKPQFGLHTYSWLVDPF